MKQNENSTMYPLNPDDSQSLWIKGEDDNGERNHYAWQLIIDPYNEHKDTLIEYQKKTQKVAFETLGTLICAIIDTGVSEGNVLRDITNAIENHNRVNTDNPITPPRIKDLSKDVTEPQARFSEDGGLEIEGSTDYPVFTLTACRLDGTHATVCVEMTWDFYPLSLVGINRRYLAALQHESQKFD